MKVLVYGAGVLGSYLAHALVRGGNDVTMLARGSRFEELRKDGLVIRHYLQRKTTVDQVKVIQTLPPDERFELIFVVMKYNDFPAVLPILAANASSHIVLVGNNATASDMQQFLQTNSLSDKKIAFGFQLSGGRREKGRMLCIRGGGQMVIGGLGAELPFKSLIDQTFAAVNYKITYHEDIDAWLKSHLPPILALNAASYVYEGNFKQIARDKKLVMKMVIAMDEGFRVLEALGYTITPAGQLTFIRNRRQLVYYFLRIYHLLPIAKLVDGSFAEIAALYRQFDGWKQRAAISTPNWDELEEAFTAKINEQAQPRV
jgi:2-dehydropantoate 2-reductase